MQRLVLWRVSSYGGCGGTQTDITARKIAEKKISLSEARYRTIVSALPDLLFQIDYEMRFTDVQTSIQEMLLAPIDQIIGKTVWELLPQNIAQLTYDKYQATNQKGEIQVYHYSLEIKGERKEFESRMVPYLDGQVLAIVRDVTEMKSAERKLEESEARYNAVINDQSELVCRFLPDGTLTFVNDAYCRYFDMEEANLFGRNFPPLASGEDSYRIQSQLFSLGADSPIITYEQRMIRFDGEEHWIEWTGRAICDEKRAVIEYQAVGRDVTERKELQNRLMEAADREQKKLAHELHDGLCQDLKGLEIEATLLEDQVADIDVTVAELAASVGRQANLAVRKAYKIARGMLPVEPDIKGFTAFTCRTCQAHATSNEFSHRNEHTNGSIA